MFQIEAPENIDKSETRVFEHEARETQLKNMGPTRTCRCVAQVLNVVLNSQCSEVLTGN
jgi:hypothetical protein